MCGVIYMEKRVANIIASTAGGTASKGSITYKLSLPSSWIKEMGLDENNTELELCFDGKSINVSKKPSLLEFIKSKKQLGHELLMLYYYNEDILCTTLCADYTDQTISFENSVDDVLSTIFGNNKLPQWSDYLHFLEDRCIPRGRDGLRWYLDAIGTDEYEPLEIIKKTKGRMAEDRQWIKVEVLK